MHIARYEVDGTIHFGALEGNLLKRFSSSPFTSSLMTGDIDQLDRVHLLCPVEAPRIFGAGLNYVSHIYEMKLKRPTVPLLFMKPTTAAIGPDEPIVYPHEGKEIHFEGELAVVMGRRARRLRKNEALDAVFGYTCANECQRARGPNPRNVDNAKRAEATKAATPAKTKLRESAGRALRGRRRSRSRMSNYWLRRPLRCATS